jgi:hypothetical protein
MKEQKRLKSPEELASMEKLLDGIRKVREQATTGKQEVES